MAVLPHALLDQHGDVLHELLEGLPGSQLVVVTLQEERALHEQGVKYMEFYTDLDWCVVRVEACLIISPQPERMMYLMVYVKWAIATNDNNETKQRPRRRKQDTQGVIIPFVVPSVSFNYTRRIT